MLRGLPEEIKQKVSNGPRAERKSRGDRERTVGEGSKGLLDTPVELLVGLSLPGEDGDSGSGDGSGGVVLKERKESEMSD